MTGRSLVLPVLAAVASAVFGAPALAEPPDAAPVGAAPRAVTLAAALAEVDRAPLVVASRLDVEAAAAAQRVAAGFGDLGISYASRRITARHSVSGSLPLDFYQRWARLRAAEAESSVAASEAASAATEARLGVREAWFELARAEDRAAAAGERAHAAARARVAVSALFESGRVPRIDNVRARAEEALASAEADDQAHQRDRAAAMLAALLPASAPVEPAAGPTVPSSSCPISTGGDRPSPVDEGELGGWVADAVGAAPSVALAQAKLGAAERAVDVARGELVPGVALEGGTDFDDPTQPGVDSWIGVSFTVPLAGWSALDEARAARAAQAVRRDGEARKARGAIEAAWHEARAARLYLAAIDTAALAAARESVALVELAYREGKSGLLEWLDAERALAEVRADRAEAYARWGRAYAELLALTRLEGS